MNGGARALQVDTGEGDSVAWAHRGTVFATASVPVMQQQSPGGAKGRSKKTAKGGAQMEAAMAAAREAAAASANVSLREVDMETNKARSPCISDLTSRALFAQLSVNSCNRSASRGLDMPSTCRRLLSARYCRRSVVDWTPSRRRAPTLCSADKHSHWPASLSLSPHVKNVYYYVVVALYLLAILPYGIDDKTHM